MTELGRTTDARALVPGDPERIEADAAALAEHGRRTEQVGQGLKRVDVTGWQGEAGARFAESWAKEPVRWLKVADSITATATVLTGYAGTLRWAQAQAAGAIELWSQAAEVSTRAYQEYRAAASAAVAAGTAIGPFIDPGEAYRQQAQEQLSRAREQLRQAGDQAVRAISGSKVGSAAAGVRVGGSLANLVDAVTDGFVVSGRGSITPRTGAGATFGGRGKLADLKAFAEYGAGWAGSMRNGQFTLSAQAEAKVAAKTGAMASVGKDGLKGNAEALIEAKSSVEGHVDYGRIGGFGKTELSVGADAHAGLNVGRNGLNVGAGAFAGAKAKEELGAELGGIQVGLSADVRAGVGADGELICGRGSDGKFHLGAKAGASAGLGAGLGFDVAVPADVEQTARDAADALGLDARAVERSVSDAAAEVRHIIGDIGKHLDPNTGIL